MKNILLLIISLLLLVSCDAIISDNTGGSGADVDLSNYYTKSEIDIISDGLQNSINNKQLGDVDTNFNEDTIYTALTDGFVLAYYSGGGAPATTYTSYIIGYSPDSSVLVSDLCQSTNTVYANIMFPVKKGNTWKIAYSSDTLSGDLVIKWFPFGD